MMDGLPAQRRGRGEGGLERPVGACRILSEALSVAEVRRTFRRNASFAGKAPALAPFGRLRAGPQARGPPRGPYRPLDRSQGGGPPPLSNSPRGLCLSLSSVALLSQGTVSFPRIPTSRRPSPRASQHRQATPHFAGTRFPEGRCPPQGGQLVCPTRGRWARAGRHARCLRRNRERDYGSFVTSCNQRAQTARIILAGMQFRHDQCFERKEGERNGKAHPNGAGGWGPGRPRRGVVPCGEAGRPRPGPTAP